MLELLKISSSGAKAESLALAELSAADFCAYMLLKVSRTFALSIMDLPDELQGAVCNAYLLCRILDTIEDDPGLQLASQQKLFKAFGGLFSQRELRDELGDTPVKLNKLQQFTALAHKLWQPQLAASPLDYDILLVCLADKVLQHYATLPREMRKQIIPYVQEMQRGMRAYVTRREQAGVGLTFRYGEAEAQVVTAIKSGLDLERYCYYVAGVVGLLLTKLFLVAYPQALGEAVDLGYTAVSFGLALQLVNIIKDLAKDSLAGRCFLPVTYLKLAKIPLDKPLDVAKPSIQRGMQQIVATLGKQARAHLQGALKYVHLWAKIGEAESVRNFTLVPLLLASKTLELIEQDPLQVFSLDKPVKVSRECVVETVTLARKAAADPGLLVEVLRELRVKNRGWASLS